MLLAGLVLSLVLHASILLPALVSIMKSDLTARPTLRADFEVEDFRRADAEPDSIDLGINESKATTMTWIGYDEYQAHMAALAEVEQAAFRTTPSGAEAAPVAPSRTPADPPATPTADEPRSLRGARGLARSDPTGRRTAGG